MFRKGNKVVLRPVLEEDIPHFHRWLNDPEVTQFIRTRRPVSLAEERAWFDGISKPKPDSVTVSVVDQQTHAVIGCMGLNRIDHVAGTANTGSLIGDKNFWGKGYGTDAKKLLLEFAFDELNLRKIYSEVIAHNERSIAYAKKCGYVEEARIPEHYYGKGRYWDKVILAAYRRDWESKKAEKKTSE